MPDLEREVFACRLLFKISSHCTSQPHDILQDNNLSNDQQNNTCQQLHSLLALPSIIKDFRTNVIS